MESRPRVLISAYACNPTRGSEHGTGWNTAWELASKYDIHVITRFKNRKDIQEFLSNSQDSSRSICFYYLDLPSVFVKAKARNFLPLSVYYFLWQIYTFFWVKHNFPKLRPSIIHHLTFNSFEFPFLWHYLSKSVVLGPLGGGQYTQFNLISLMKGSKIKEAVRNFRVFLSSNNPFILNGIRNAVAVGFANQETRSLLMASCKAYTFDMIDVGVDCDKFFPLSRREPNDQMSLLFVGKFEPRKGIWLLPRIVDELQKLQIDFSFTLIGDGPCFSAIKNIFLKNFPSCNISFLGKVSHAQTIEYFQRSDFLLFPSLRDTSGAVVLESMACGCPVVALDHQGAALMLDDESGILISPKKFKSHSALSREIAKRLHFFYTRQDIHFKMQKAARSRAEKFFSWQAKATSFSMIYDTCLGNKSNYSKI